MSAEALQNGWVILAFPLFAEDGDALGRPVDAMLWPERFCQTDFPSVGQGEISSRSFAALYQQRPVPMEGGLIKATWLEHRYSTVPGGLRVTMSLDAASKTGVENDWSAIVVLGTDKKRYFVLDVIRRKVDFPGLRNMVLSAYEQHQPRTIYIEDAANAVGLIQELKKETRLPVVAVVPKGSKISRVEAQTGLLESGNVLLPDERTIAAPWLLEFERELLAFPGGKHDDQVDALTLALSQARKGGGFTPGLFEYFASGSNVDFDVWRSQREIGAQPAILAQPGRRPFG